MPTNEHALESALARAPQRYAHAPESDLADLAAAYGHGLASSHPFADGNRCVAFATMAVFLGLSGLAIEAPEGEVVTVVLALAGGELDEAELAEWLRSRLAGRAKRKSG